MALELTDYEKELINRSLLKRSALGELGINLAQILIDAEESDEVIAIVQNPPDPVQLGIIKLKPVNLLKWQNNVGTQIMELRQDGVLSLKAAPVSDETGGDNRGTFATDLQFFRGDDTQVPKGYSSGLFAGEENRIQGDGTQTGTGWLSAVVGGRLHDVINARAAGILGGDQHTLKASLSAIIGGQQNTIEGTGAPINDFGPGAASVILGGWMNVINAPDSEHVILGGEQNTISGYAANLIGATWNSTIAAEAGQSVILGGSSHEVGNGTDFILGSGIFGGSNHLVHGHSAVAVGGINHLVHGHSAVAVGGSNHSVSVNATASAIVGGDNNTVDKGSAVVVGGQFNTLQARSAGIFAGNGNILTGDENAYGNGFTAVLLGGSGNTISASNWVTTPQYGQAIIGGDAHSILVGAGPTFASGIFTGESSTIESCWASVIVGGYSNSMQGVNDFDSGYQGIFAGRGNSMTGLSSSSVILGGESNQVIAARWAGVMGRQSTASADGAWVLSDSRALAKTNATANSLLLSFENGIRLDVGHLATDKIRSATLGGPLQIQDSTATMFMQLSDFDGVFGEPAWVGRDFAGLNFRSGAGGYIQIADENYDNFLYLDPAFGAQFGGNGGVFSVRDGQAAVFGSLQLGFIDDPGIRLNFRCAEDVSEGDLLELATTTGGTNSSVKRAQPWSTAPLIGIAAADQVATERVNVTVSGTARDILDVLNLPFGTLIGRHPTLPGRSAAVTSGQIIGYAMGSPNSFIHVHPGYSAGLDTHLQGNHFTAGGKQIPADITDLFVAAVLRFDEAAGSLTVPTGCTAAGTVFTAVGGPVYSQQAPLGLGTGIYLNPGDYFTTTVDVDALDVSNVRHLFIDVWVKVETASGPFVYKIDTGGAYTGYEVGVATDHFYFYVSDGTEDPQVDSPIDSLIVGKWQRVRATWLYDTDTLTIQVDDGPITTLVHGSPVGSLSNVQPVIVGDNQGGVFSGTIADLRISIPTLSPASQPLLSIAVDPGFRRPGQDWWNLEGDTVASLDRFGLLSIDTVKMLTPSGTFRMKDSDGVDFLSYNANAGRVDIGLNTLRAAGVQGPAGADLRLEGQDFGNDFIARLDGANAITSQHPDVAGAIALLLNTSELTAADALLTEWQMQSVGLASIDKDGGAHFNSITAFTTNGDLTLKGNGTGGVTLFGNSQNIAEFTAPGYPQIKLVGGNGAFVGDAGGSSTTFARDDSFTAGIDFNGDTNETHYLAAGGQYRWQVDSVELARLDVASGFKVDKITALTTGGALGLSGQFETETFYVVDLGTGPIYLMFDPLATSGPGIAFKDGGTDQARFFGGTGQVAGIHIDPSDVLRIYADAGQIFSASADGLTLLLESLGGAAGIQVDDAAGTGSIGLFTTLSNIDVANSGDVYLAVPNANFIRAQGAIRLGTSTEALIISDNDTVPLTLKSRKFDSGTAVAHVLTTDSAYVTAGAKLLSIQNNGVEKFAFSANDAAFGEQAFLGGGNLNMRPGPGGWFYVTSDTAAFQLYMDDVEFTAVGSGSSVQLSGGNLSLNGSGGSASLGLSSVGNVGLAGTGTNGITFALMTADFVMKPDTAVFGAGEIALIGPAAQGLNMRAGTGGYVQITNDDYTTFFYLDDTTIEIASSGEASLAGDTSAVIGNLGTTMTVENNLFSFLGGQMRLATHTDGTRGAAGTAGRVIFNSTDGNLNIDDGTNWILPDGTVT